MLTYLVFDRFLLLVGTDILPAEIPKESSKHFGDAVVKVLDELSQYHYSNKAGGSPSSVIDLQHGPPLLVRVK